MDLSDLSKKSTLNKRLYSIAELPIQIGATEWFWRTQIWNKNIPVIRIGRTQYIDSEDLEKFLENHKYWN
jgi:hypothetical protein